MNLFLTECFRGVWRDGREIRKGKKKGWERGKRKEELGRWQVSVTADVTAVLFSIILKNYGNWG